MTHTPGPWKVIEVRPMSMVMAGDHPTLPILGPTMPIAGVRLWVDDEDTAVANAQLMASSPDLLEALRELLKEGDAPEHTGMQGKRLYFRAVGAARAAIAKAEGGSE